MTRFSGTAAARVALFALIGLATACTASAGTISSWSQSGTTTPWSANANWVGGSGSKPTTTGTYSLVYSGTTTNTTSNNNVGVVNIDSMLFSNDGSAGQSQFTVGSTSTNSITLLNGAAITTTAISGTTLLETISSDVTMSGTNNNRSAHTIREQSALKCCNPPSSVQISPCLQRRLFRCCDSR